MIASSPTRATRLRSLVRQTKAGDYVLMAAFALFSASGFLMNRFGSGHERALTAAIVIADQLTATLDLSEDRSYVFNGTLGEVRVEVHNGAVGVTASTCPNKFCLRQGEVRNAGEMVICVPNHLIVHLQGGSGQAGLDGITY